MKKVVLPGRRRNEKERGRQRRKQVGAMLIVRGAHQKHNMIQRKMPTSRV